MTERSGQQFGQYRLLRLLGQGGFAEVYLAEHIHLKTQAAIKVLYGKLTQQHVQTFTSEAQTIATLRHPHILRVLDFGFEQGLPFLVMDYASGGALRDRHPCGTIVPLATAVSYIKELSAALAYAHSRKLIHRDVKPENMLIDADEHILLSDFGIVTMAHSTASLKTMDNIGTPHYMAPEQIQGKPRPQSDQYALAIVAYEWLCGERPFTGDSLMAIVMQHLTVQPPPFRTKETSVSPKVEEVIIKALSKDPELRFPDILAFATALEQATQLMDGKALVISINRPVLSGMRSSTPDQKVLSPTEPLPLPTTNAQTLRIVGQLHLTPGANTTREIGTCLFTYFDPLNIPTKVVWSPDGRFIASRSGSGLCVWDAITGEYRCSRHMYNDAFCWSPDGEHLIVEGGRDTSIININTNEMVSSFKLGDLRDIVISPTGTHIACFGSVYHDKKNPVKVWDISLKKISKIYREHHARVKSVDWSPDGQHIVSAGTDGKVRVWNIETGKTLLVCEHGIDEYGEMSVAWSPNGQYIASSGYVRPRHNFYKAGDSLSFYLIKVWDITTGKAVSEYPGHSMSVSAIAWSPNSRWIVSGSNDTTVHIWDALTGHAIFEYKGHTEGVTTVAWSSNGNYIASGGWDKTIQIWQAPQ